MLRAIGLASVFVLASVGLAACCSHAPRETPLDRANELDEAAWLMRADLVVASGRMEVAVAEYYNIYGKLPASNSDAGLPKPEDYQGKTLRSASVGPKGVIEFAFDAKSGKDGGRVRLIPDTSHAAAMSIQWRCETSDYPQIKHVLPICDYVPR
jgi:Pilin (bacterial filament)